MNALLVLLALLAVGAVASRQGGARAVAVVAAAPLLVGLGWLVGPQGLAFVYPSWVHSLDTPMEVGAAWLAFLVGLRALPVNGRPWLAGAAWLTVTGGAAFVVCGGVTAALLHAWPQLLPDHAPPDALAWALGGLVSGTGFVGVLGWTESWADGPLKRRLQFVAMHDDVFGGCAALALMTLAQPWWTTDVGRLPSVLVLLGSSGVLAVGALLGVLVVPTQERWMPLAAVTAMGAGLGMAAGWPSVLVTMAAGAALGMSGLGRRVDGANAQTTDRAVRLLVMVLAGLNLTVSWQAVAVGAALAGARLVGKALQARLLGVGSMRVNIQVLLGSSGLAIPLAVSVVSAPVLGTRSAFALAAVVTCVCITELLVLVLGLGQWLKAVPRRSITAGALRKVEEEHTGELRLP